ncbi:hypothetical protein J8J14_06995 [Roseomonas sp. SSH11]|uniref:Uncharacterized protein n=1 Tax=Pararoseomonas baculiformis TaxID=2820812 RepID=A0ABS4ABY7_9PROT|nr:hypothetical protein [Pararoseomonas baculiformis]MBP0444525.1 hypothetical protein [Pararoseomonas baculiformis]
MRHPPIAVMSFNRPDYLRQVLASLAAQQDARIEERQVFLFQDHWNNRRSGRVKADAKDIDASIATFREIFPRGEVLAAEENLGVAENFLRAETLFFREMKADCAYFLEDDLVLAPRYLRIMDMLRTGAEGTPEIGYFAAYGHLTASAADQLKHRRMLRRIGHLWGFGLFRRHWEAMQPLMADYYEMVLGRDYKDRSTPDIRRRYRERDILVGVTSQDDVKKAVTYALGHVALNTHLVSGRYIGAVGLHMSQERFDQAGYARTVWIDPEELAFDFPDAPALAAMQAEETERRRQAIENEAKPQPKSPAPRPAPKPATPPAPSRRPVPEGDTKARPLLRGPHMSAEERQLLERMLASGRRRYAEFGTGGSTLLAARQGFDLMVGVESDPAWARTVREDEEVAAVIAAGRASILHADIGPVGAWGSPVDRNAIRPWPNYIARMWEEWDRLGTFPDLVFVDGRFRVACCLSTALLAAAHRGQHPPPLVMIHDVGERRPNYDRALDFFHIEEQVGTLRVMSPRLLRSPEAILAAFLGRIFEVV